ncbi:MAG: hypothetical protein RJB60_712 [Pseudomonadota bacterium]|jgi:hypothetical protein
MGTRHNHTMSDDLTKWIVAAVLALVAIFLWRAWQDKQASVAWPSVEGLVTQCEAEVDSPDPHQEFGSKMPGVSWRLRLRYTYVVAGQAYTGDRLRAMPERFPTREDAAVFEQQFKVGQKVRVYHDPAKPSSSVLIPG